MEGRPVHLSLRRVGPRTHVQPDHGVSDDGDDSITLPPRWCRRIDAPPIQGPTKMSSFAVEASLFFTLVELSVSTLPELKIPPPWPSVVPMALLPLITESLTVTVLLSA